MACITSPETSSSDSTTAPSRSMCERHRRDMRRDDYSYLSSRLSTSPMRRTAWHSPSTSRFRAPGSNAVTVAFSRQTTPCLYVAPSWDGLQWTCTPLKSIPPFWRNDVTQTDGVYLSISPSEHPSAVLRNFSRHCDKSRQARKRVNWRCREQRRDRVGVGRPVRGRVSGMQWR